MKTTNHKKTDDYWRPDFRSEKVSTIDFKKLKKEGIDSVAIDIDGTLVAGIFDMVVSQEFIDFLKKSKESKDIKKIFVATNRWNFAAERIAEQISADGLVCAKAFQRKPMQGYYQRLLDVMDTEPEKCLMVGDRLWQDIYGGNRLGMKTLLVDDFGPPQWYDILFFRRWRQNRRLKKLKLDK